jgi:hypothetical protein
MFTQKLRPLIHDYLALSTLLGRTTKGYVDCIYCDNHPLSYRLRSKIGYFFVPKEHHLWRTNEFAKLHESNDPVGEFFEEEVLVELERVKDIRLRNPQGTGKRKHSKLEGVMCEFGAKWLILEVTILEKTRAET